MSGAVWYVERHYGFLRLALSFRLGRSCLAFLLRLSSCQPLLLRLVRLVLCFRVGCLALFLPLKLGLLHASLYSMPKECETAPAD